jgi:predicted hydrocarbon binding protein
MAFWLKWKQMMPDLEAALSLKTTQTLLDGICEIIGLDDLNSALNLAGIDYKKANESLSFSSIALIENAFDELFGARGGRGVMLRSGRATFKYFLRECGQSLGFNLLEYRLLSSNQRLRTGLEKLAQYFSKYLESSIKFKQDDTSWYWEVADCRECAGRNAATSLCQFTIGFLQDFLAWAGNGKNYRVSEIECRAAGGHCCLFKVDKKPLE